MARSRQRRPEAAERSSRVRDALAAGPRLAATALRRGVLPIGPSAVGVLRREGASELHWKVLGDALARFLRHSGPVLTKLGQILATRHDLLPESLCRRLEALYTRQPAMPKRELQRILRARYGRRTPFRRFEWTPVAVGSIGQVHRAQLRDRSRVVVKVLRPGVEQAVARDLRSVRALVDLGLQLVSGAGDSARRVAARALDDLEDAFATETNLEHEAEAFEEFARRFRRNPRVRIPVCHRQWSSREVLVLEELSGEPLSALRERAKSDPEAARRAANLALKEILIQIFEVGRFHGDPHGGNLLLMEDGRLGLIDLGLTGELAVEDRRNLIRAVRAFLSRDRDASLDALLRFGASGPDFDRADFERELTALFRRSKDGVAARVTGRAGDGEESVRLEELVNQLFVLAERHDLHLPRSTVLLVKTLVTIEGVARSLDPEIDVAVTALPVLLRSLTPRWLRWSAWRGAAS